MEKTEFQTAVFGGSFDPPHCVHVMAVGYALSCTPCQDAWVVPCYSHAFGKEMASFEARMDMCRAAFSIFGKRVRVLDVESRLPAPSYTVQTLRHLVDLHPGRTFRLVIGSDVLPETSEWKEWDEVRRIAPPIIMQRVGAPPAAQALTPLFPDVSSSDIRERLIRHRPVDDLVPIGVLRVIHERRLYGT
ncbi:MAG: nicotinate-nicotinamide nucleotide adenylyltransferase [Deltaproteobacteria bacterium]|nr:nicotinate-nicotinamide nucleotide adenylyltransferase [Deltaproteobacteria bacterium]